MTRKKIPPVCRECAGARVYIKGGEGGPTGGYRETVQGHRRGINAPIRHRGGGGHHILSNYTYPLPSQKIPAAQAECGKLPSVS